jgi:hypothetical protein
VYIVVSRIRINLTKELSNLDCSYNFIQIPSSFAYFSRITWWWPAWAETCCEWNNKTICLFDGNLWIPTHEGDLVMKYKRSFNVELPVGTHILMFRILGLLSCRTLTTRYTDRSLDEETAFKRDIGCDVSPWLRSPSPLARVQSLADPLTWLSVLAHFYKNTVKR